MSLLSFTYPPQDYQKQAKPTMLNMTKNMFVYAFLLKHITWETRTCKKLFSYTFKKKGFLHLGFPKEPFSEQFLIFYFFF